MDNAYLLVLAFITVLVWTGVARCRQIHLPLATFGGSYLVTTVVGATLIGVVGPEVIDLDGWGLDTSRLRDLSSLTYWGLLFAPLIVPPLVYLLVRDLVRRLAKPPHGARRERPIGVLPYTLLFGAMTAYCLVLMERQGFTLDSSFWTALQWDYTAIILLRNDVIEKLGNYFAGIVYVSLPTLSHCALAECVRERRLAWRVLFGLTFTVTALLCVAIMQKSPLLIYTMSLSFGLVYLGVIRPRTLALVSLAGFATLSVLIWLSTGQWGLRITAELMVFRTASAFPWYVKLYPDVLPHFGADFGLHLLGIVTPPRDNLDVFAYMYPSVTWVQGASAAPAHIRAFAQAGVGFSVAVLCFIGVAIAAVDELRVRARGPLRYAAYMQGLMFLYYLTQVSVVDALLSSYGLCWALAALAPLWLLNAVFGTSARAPSVFPSYSSKGRCY